MKLWQLLYGMVWLTFLQIVLLFVLPASSVYVIMLHAVLGLAILGLAYYDNSMMKKMEVPARLKRILRSTVTLAGAQLFLGIFLYLVNLYNFGSLVNGIVSFLHFAIALAIITQASSVATAYDMWEEKEYSPPYTDTRSESSNPV